MVQLYLSVLLKQRFKNEVWELAKLYNFVFYIAFSISGNRILTLLYVIIYFKPNQFELLTFAPKQIAQYSY